MFKQGGLIMKPSSNYELLKELLRKCFFVIKGTF